MLSFFGGLGVGCRWQRRTASFVRSSMEALASAARLGILIKNVGDIEIAARINAFVFDKTGTLTTGELAVSRLAPQGDIKPAELLKVAATAEKFSNHPTAKALVNLAEEAGVKLADPADFKETAGRGIQASVDGASIVIGRAQWLRDNGVTDDFESKMAEGIRVANVLCSGNV